MTSAQTLTGKGQAIPVWYPLAQFWMKDELRRIPSCTLNLNISGCSPQKKKDETLVNLREDSGQLGHNRPIRTHNHALGAIPKNPLTTTQWMRTFLDFLKLHCDQCSQVWTKQSYSCAGQRPQDQLSRPFCNLSPAIWSYREVYEKTHKCKSRSKHVDKHEPL